MRNHPCFQISDRTHHARDSSGYIQILRQHKFNASHQNIPAVWIMMRRNRNGLQATLVLPSAFINLRQNHRQRCPSCSYCFSQHSLNTGSPTVWTSARKEEADRYKLHQIQASVFHTLPGFPCWALSAFQISGNV